MKPISSRGRNDSAALESHAYALAMEKQQPNKG